MFRRPKAAKCLHLLFVSLPGNDFSQTIKILLKLPGSIYKGVYVRIQKICSL